MNRNTWRLEYRNARNVRRFNAWAIHRAPSIDLISLAVDVPMSAWSAACRWGDPLRFPAYRRDGRYRSRLSGTPV
jgi:hypothetical protein